MVELSLVALDELVTFTPVTLVPVVLTPVMLTRELLAQLGSTENLSSCATILMLYDPGGGAST